MIKPYSNFLFWKVPRLDWLGLLFFVSAKGIKKHFIILMLRK